MINAEYNHSDREIVIRLSVEDIVDAAVEYHDCTFTPREIGTYIATNITEFDPENKGMSDMESLVMVLCEEAARDGVGEQEDPENPEEDDEEEEDDDEE